MIKLVLPWPCLEISRKFIWLYQISPTMDWFPLLSSPHRLPHISSKADRVRARVAAFCSAFFKPRKICSIKTHWGRVTHICVNKLTIIGSDNGLSPGRHQAIIWTNAGILLIGPLGTNFNETSIEIHTFSFKKIHLKLSSGKWRPFCLGLNVLNG